MSDLTERDQEASDGRLERTIATRRRILDATRTLLLEGVDEPTAREIADAASITTRTLFRHFTDMASLFQTMVDEAESHVMAVRDEAFPDDGTARQPEDRLQAIIDRRCRVYETLLPLYVSRIWSKRRSANRGRQRSEWVIRGRQRLKEALPDTIAHDETLFDAIDATLGIDYWVSLRREQRLSATRARMVLERAVAKLTS